MKTMVAFAMALATLILTTAADAACVIGVRAGRTYALNHGCYRGQVQKSLAIIERPQNVTAVLRADGVVVLHPKPGFTGQDSITVRVNRIDPTSRTFEPQFTTVTQTYVISVY
jgi:hypothetical protein